MHSRLVAGQPGMMRMMQTAPELPKDYESSISAGGFLLGNQEANAPEQP